MVLHYFGHNDLLEDVVAISVDAYYCSEGPKLHGVVPPLIKSSSWGDMVEDNQMHLHLVLHVTPYRTTLMSKLYISSNSTLYSNCSLLPSNAC